MNWLAKLFHRQVPTVHNWVVAYSQLTPDHTQYDFCYRCEDCGIYKHEYLPIGIDEMEEAHKDMEMEMTNE